jgi:hypothetical protein
VPIADADIQFRLSGGAGNSSANASTGGVMSSTAWTGGTLHDLFDAISGDDNAASVTDYRCIYVRNNHATLTWGPNVKAWFSAVTAGGASLAIGLATQGVGNGTSTGVASTIANENTAPAPAVTFLTDTVATSKGAGLSLPDIPAQSAHAIWIRRVAANTAALSNDGATIQVQGDTPA